MIERSKFTDYFALSEQKAKDQKPPRRGTRFERQRVSRIMAIQAFFEATHNKQDLGKTRQTYLDHDFTKHHHPIHPDRDMFIHLVTTLQNHQDRIEAISHPLVVGHWSTETMDPLLLSILKTGIAELIAPIKPTKPSILICEYVEITKGFYDDKESGYINKALDQAAKVIDTPIS